MDSEKTFFVFLIAIVVFVLIVTFLCITIKLVRQFLLADKQRETIVDRLKQASCSSTINEHLIVSSTKTNSGTLMPATSEIESSALKRLPAKESTTSFKINAK